MTGSLFAPLPISSPSPVRRAAPNYSVDSFSEFSTRTVNRVSCSPISAASGPRSARAKEEDEELFRDLFAGDRDADVDEESSAEYNAASTFIPQKPITRRAPSSTGNPDPRQHITPMKPALPLLTPFIPRLNLEELLNTRPDDDDEDSNNNSQKISQRDSELEQVAEEDESCSDDGPNEASDSKTALKNKQGLTSDQKFNGLANNQRANKNEKLDQETLLFLEKLDLKVVLHTPRPDLLNFYPVMATTPASRNMASPHSKTPGFPVKLTKDCFVENRPGLEKDQISVIQEEKGNAVFKVPLKVPTVDGVATRLAYMESTYGTAPIVRKTRRETIDRLANPISGHSSTLQALSPKQRKKREAAFTSRAPLRPISAAIAVSSRRGTTAKREKTPPTLHGEPSKRIGDCEIPAPGSSKRKAVKRQDPLVHKRQSKSSTNPHVDGQGPTVNGLTKRKSKPTLGSCSLVARKEAWKQKLRSQASTTKRGGDREIGGSTFLTQRDDEEAVELIEDFIARNRGVAQAQLISRSSRKAPPHHTIPALPTRNPSTARTRPQPPQTHTGRNFARALGVNKNTHRGRRGRTGTAREVASLDNFTDLKTQRQRAPTTSTRSGPDHEPVKLFQQPKRPQAWQTSHSVGRDAIRARSLTGRPTTPGDVTNPIRKLKVHPAMPTLLSRAPKTPPSAAATLLMGSTPHFSSTTGSGEKSVRIPSQVTKKISSRKADGSTSTTFDAPTKLSEQRRRTSTTARSKCGENPPAPRQTFAVRRSTSRV